MKHATLSLPACGHVLARTQRGAALMELLVALLILSTGLLGMASLQVRAIGYVQHAWLRSQATFLAAEMAELLRTGDAEQAALTGWQQRLADSLPEATATIDNSVSNTAQLHAVHIQWQWPGSMDTPQVRLEVRP